MRYVEFHCAVLQQLKYCVRSSRLCSRVILFGCSNVVVGIHEIPLRGGGEEGEY